METQASLVATFEDPITARIACARLDAEGIDARLLDENFIGLDPLMSRALGGIKLMVEQKDLDKARTTLAQRVAVEPETCAECGSAEVTRHDAGRRAAWLSILLLGLPIGRSRSLLRCNQCGHSSRG